VCGEGLGHTTRMIPLAKELLDGGHEVFFGSYGYSKRLLEDEGFRVFEAPKEIVLTGSDGVFDLKKSVLETLKNPVVFKIPKIFSILKKSTPDVVLSDVYYTGILCSKFKGLPVCMVTNQANMQEFFQNQGVTLGLLGFLVKLFYNAVFRLVDNIIVPDFPPPKTVCAKNLRFEKKISGKVFYSGPLVRRSESKKKLEFKRPMVLSTIGGFGYRSVLLEKIIEAARLDGKINYTLLLPPGAGKKRFKNTPENIVILDFTENPISLIRDADLVIASGGHSTIMEAVAYATPVISCPDSGQREQENNALGVEALGVGARISYSSRPEDILKTIVKTLGNDALRNKVLEMSKEYDSMIPQYSVRKLLESGG